MKLFIGSKNSIFGFLLVFLLSVLSSPSYSGVSGNHPTSNGQSLNTRLASVSVGPVDFVEDNVEKLDEKVRKVLEAQEPDTFTFQTGCNSASATGSSITGNIVSTATTGGTMYVGTEPSGPGDLGLYAIDLVGCNVTGPAPSTLTESTFQDMLITKSDSVLVLTQNESRLYETNMDLTKPFEKLSEQPIDATAEYQVVGEDTFGQIYIGGEKLRALRGGNQRWVRGSDTGLITDLFITEDNYIVYLNQDPSSTSNAYEIGNFFPDGSEIFLTGIQSPDPASDENSFATMVPGEENFYVRYEERVREEYGDILGDPSNNPSPPDPDNFPLSGSFYIRQDVIHSYEIIDENGDEGVKDNLPVDFLWGTDYRDRTGLFHLTPELVGMTSNLVSYDTEGFVWSIDATQLNKGQVWWKSQISGSIKTSIPGLIGADGTIYLSGNNAIYLVNSADQTSKSMGTWSDPEPVALHRGSLVVIHGAPIKNKFTVADGVPSFKTADTPWPVRGGNNRRSKLTD